MKASVSEAAANTWRVFESAAAGAHPAMNRASSKININVRFIFQISSVMDLFRRLAALAVQESGIVATYSLSEYIPGIIFRQVTDFWDLNWNLEGPPWKQ